MRSVCLTTTVVFETAIRPILYAGCPICVPYDYYRGKRSLRRLCFYTCLSVHRGEHLGRYPPGRYTPSRKVGTPTWAGTPPRQVQPPLGYGQQAGGTYPTGMHSCHDLYFKKCHMCCISANIMLVQTTLKMCGRFTDFT